MCFSFKITQVSKRKLVKKCVNSLSKQKIAYKFNEVTKIREGNAYGAIIFNYVRKTYLLMSKIVDINTFIFRRVFG